jgi:hypothetical protein
LREGAIGRPTPSSLNGHHAERTDQLFVFSFTNGILLQMPAHETAADSVSPSALNGLLQRIAIAPSG